MKTTLEKLTTRREQTSSQVYFTLTGDFPVTEVSRRLGLEPTSSFNKGDEKRLLLDKENKPLYHCFSKWCYGTEYEITRDIPAQCEAVLSALYGKVAAINKIIKKYDCQARLQIVSVIEKGETPALSVEQKVMNFCVSVKADIDIDLYANAYGEEN